MADKLYPVQIQADNLDADDSNAACMCHVFDISGEVTVISALSKVYRHVIAWDAQGNVIYTYDNR